MYEANNDHIDFTKVFFYKASENMLLSLFITSNHNFIMTCFLYYVNYDIHSILNELLIRMSDLLKKNLYTSTGKTKQ